MSRTITSHTCGRCGRWIDFGLLSLKGVTECPHCGAKFDRAAVKKARIVELFNSESFTGVVVIASLGAVLVIGWLIVSIYDGVASAGRRRAADQLADQLTRPIAVELEAIPSMDLDPSKMTYTVLSRLDTHNGRDNCTGAPTVVFGNESETQLCSWHDGLVAAVFKGPAPHDEQEIKRRVPVAVCLSPVSIELYARLVSPKRLTLRGVRLGDSLETLKNTWGGVLRGGLIEFTDGWIGGYELVDHPAYKGAPVVSRLWMYKAEQRSSNVHEIVGYCTIRPVARMKF